MSLLNHVLEGLQRTNANSPAGRLGVSPNHFVGARLANLAFRQSGLVLDNNLAESGDGKHSDTALLGNALFNFGGQSFENGIDFLLGKAGRFCNVVQDLGLGRGFACGGFLGHASFLLGL